MAEDGKHQYHRHVIRKVVAQNDLLNKAPKTINYFTPASKG